MKVIIKKKWCTCDVKVNMIKQKWHIARKHLLVLVEVAMIACLLSWGSRCQIDTCHWSDFLSKYIAILSVGIIEKVYLEMKDGMFGTIEQLPFKVSGDMRIFQTKFMSRLSKSMEIMGLIIWWSHRRGSQYLPGYFSLFGNRTLAQPAEDQKGF